MTVEISVTDGVQVLRLARPEKRNALNLEMYRALTDALERSDAAAVLEHMRSEAAEFARCLTSPEARAAFEAFFSRSRSGQDLK